MSNINTLIANAVKEAKITDFIVLVRNKCYTVIKVEDFIHDITFGGQPVCDTLINCWHSMGQFDVPEISNDDIEEIPDNNDEEQSIHTHFPKGEGIKVIQTEDAATIPDSIYILPVEGDKYKMIIVDQEGIRRDMDMQEISYPVTDGRSVGNGVPVYRGLVNGKIDIASIVSDSLNISAENGVVRIEMGAGKYSITANIFKRDATQPATPTGGSYASPAPAGWSIGLPAEDGNPAWMSTRILTSDGQTPQQATWSTPVMVGNTSTLEFSFSAFIGTNPGTPTTPLNGATWHTESQTNDVWMAFRKIENGAVGVWSVVRTKGEQGPAGTVGSGFNVVLENPVQSIAVGSDSITSSPLSYLVPIRVYNNGTQLTATVNSVLAADQFRIELPVSPYAGVTVTKENSSTLKYSIASGTTLPDTSISSLIKIKATSANTELSASFTILPVKTAEDAYALTLQTDSNVVKFDAFGNLQAPTVIQAMAVQQNYTEVITWSSVPPGIVSGTGTLRTIDTSTLFSDDPDAVSVKIKISTPNGLSDETTIFKIQDGMDGGPGSPGAPGPIGTTGPTPRLLEMVSGGQYENGGEFIDYAYYRTADTAKEGWYTVKIIGGVRTVITHPGGEPSLTAWTKAPFTKEMSFGTVIAEQANLAGFIFRNQILNSQTGANTSSCHPTPGVHLPNLSLDGLQGIIRFLDKMILNQNGITLKDDCGRPRMVFQWVDGSPMLRFYDEIGSITWEAGKEGYVVRTQGTTQPSWGSNIGFRKITTLTEGEAADFSDTSSGNYVTARNFIRNNYISTSPNSATQVLPHPTTGTSDRVYFITQTMPNTGTFTNNAGPANYYTKGDIIANEDQVQAYYIVKTPVTSVPSSNLLPDGWYLQEATSGYNGEELQNETVSFEYPTETVDYYTDIVYVRNGVVVRIVKIQIHRRTFNV